MPYNISQGIILLSLVIIMGVTVGVSYLFSKYSHIGEEQQRELISYMKCKLKLQETNS
jgi:uncharacterized membrane protein